MSADEVFESLSNDGTSAEYDFTSEEDMDNNESMRAFIENHDLEEFVAEDDGTMVFLSHDDYDFQVVLESFGLGDFFSHRITMARAEV